MKAILIDPFAREVREIEVAAGIDAIYAAIGAECFCTVGLPDGDAIYLDDEGVFRDKQQWFAVGNYPHPLAGKGLILGCDEEGESCDPQVTGELIRAHVHWLTAGEVVAMGRDVKAEMERAAAAQNALGGDAFVVVAQPDLEIDESGHARGLG